MPSEEKQEKPLELVVMDCPNRMIAQNIYDRDKFVNFRPIVCKIMIEGVKPFKPSKGGFGIV